MCDKMISTKVKRVHLEREDRRVKMLAWDPFSPTRKSTDTGDQANLTLVKLSHDFLFQLWHIKSLEVNTIHWHQLSILVGYSLRPENKKKGSWNFPPRFFFCPCPKPLARFSSLKKVLITPPGSYHTALGHSPNMSPSSCLWADIPGHISSA